ncbi:hypothetical protein IWQ60_011639 [Tieghemiomyces parasiticus]|uniref:NAD(+) kinase n=1 Tax=Tieghemiomyces parasiticus TaxID=78921 RepID=A0A9W7ZI84_9FUNG|nr:hypothetical protein IWQ60_011639 [Tieghemiomyces parasiticus]
MSTSPFPDQLEEDVQQFSSIHAPLTPDPCSSESEDPDPEADVPDQNCAVHCLLDPSLLRCQLVSPTGSTSSRSSSRHPSVDTGSSVSSTKSGIAPVGRSLSYSQFETSSNVASRMLPCIAKALAENQSPHHGNDSKNATTSAIPPGLVETAVSVRELSKRIGRARVKWQRCKRAMIVTKLQDRSLVDKCREIALWLINTPLYSDSQGMAVYVDAKFAHSKRFGYARLVEDQPLCRDKLRFWTPELCNERPNMFDFVITLGGDGTVLYTSYLFQRIVPAVIPFHMGSLGFLTCFDFANYQNLLVEALHSGVRVNLRMRFTCTVFRARCRLADKANLSGDTSPGSATEGHTDEDDDNDLDADQGSLGERPCATLPNISRSRTSTSTHPPQPDERFKHCFKDPYLQSNDVDRSDSDSDLESSSALINDKNYVLEPGEQFQVLNEVTVDRGPSPYLSVLELFGDRNHLTTVQADGLTIATPTGSTAYSLAAGGALVHPEIPAILITPNCPHTLSFRPMLLPEATEVIVAVPFSSRNTAWASFDGRHRTELRRGDHIQIVASKYPFPTICHPNHTTSKDWFNSLNRCLHWNQRARQKGFA